MKMATIGTAIRLNDMMSAPIRNITNAMNMMLSSWNDLDDATSSGLDVRNVETIRSELNQATRALDQMGKEQEQFNREVQEGSNAMDGLTDKIIGAVGAFAGMQGLQQLVNLSDSFTQTTARLNMINDGAQTTDELFDKIAASADRARARISQTADTVAKLSLNADDAFASNDETILFAENLNKLFAIAGTEQASIASASLQLTQALGSGVLRGEEFNAVFEAAPNIMQTVADYMGVPIGQLRSMAQEGQITAGVVKNALLSATGEINAQFESMPMTWGQVWNEVMNGLYYASIPLLEVINLLANNWSVLEPIVLGVAAAMGIYVGALMIYNAIKGISALVESVHAASIAMSTGATFAATAAQHGFNAALLACPITWIIIAVIALIAIVYAVVAAINKLQGTSVSATGIIAGAFAWLGALIWNIVIGVLNACIQALWTIFVEPWIGIIEWVLNVFNGGFNSFGDAVKNLLGNIISWFLSLGQVVTKIIDAIFGTDWTGGLEDLKGKVLEWGKNENAITLSREAPLELNRTSMTDAWDAGYDFGAGFEGSVKSFFGGGTGETYSMDDLTASIGEVPVLDDIAGNTGDIRDSLDISGENLKYMRDLAEQDAVNRFTTAEIRVEMTNNNNVSSDMDLDGVVDYMVTGVQEAMERVAEGVHN